MRRAPLAAALALGLTLSACATLGPSDTGPRPDPVARLTPTGPSPWREDFGDPVLHDLLARADAGALDIKQALAHFERAQADVEAARATGGPRAQAGVIAAVGDRKFRGVRSAATPTLDAAFDMDLWGRLAHGRAAARSDRQAAGSDVTAARLLIGAETSRAYVALRAAQADAAAARARREAAAQALALASRRAEQGATLRSVVAERRLDVERADDAAQAAEEEVDLQSARLADLTGQSALTLAGGDMFTPPPSQAAAPSAVVDRRPDVQAAYARLAAADGRRAQAIAASRPDFQIALALGSPDAAIATLLDVKALAWAAAASLTQSIFDGGARRATVHAATAEADLADIAYRQAVLKAWSEVRAAGAEEAQARRRLAAEQAAATLARASLATSRVRHDQGAADGLDLAAAQVALLDADQAERQARRQLADACIQRLLAMGGG